MRSAVVRWCRGRSGLRSHPARQRSALPFDSADGCRVEFRVDRGNCGAWIEGRHPSFGVGVHRCGVSVLASTRGRGNDDAGGVQGAVSRSAGEQSDAARAVSKDRGRAAVTTRSIRDPGREAHVSSHSSFSDHQCPTGARPSRPTVAPVGADARRLLCTPGVWGRSASRWPAAADYAFTRKICRSDSGSGQSRAFRSVDHQTVLEAR